MSAHQILAPMILASLLVAARRLRLQRDRRGPRRAHRRRVERRRLQADPARQRRADQCLGARRRRSGPRPTWSSGAAPMRGSRASPSTSARAARCAGMIDAELARQRPGGWRLFDVRIYDTDMNVVRKRADARRAGRGRGRRASRSPRSIADERGFRSLNQAIVDLDRAGRPTDEARSGWWHKISGPLSIVLMPLLAGARRVRAGAIGPGAAPRRDRHGARLRLFRGRQSQPGAGQCRRLSAVLAAWAPFLLFLLIGETVLVRSEE